jgi:hypothetical protein
MHGPRIDTHRPVLLSQTSPFVQVRPPGCAQPSVHAPAMQIWDGGLHCGSVLHPPIVVFGTHVPPEHDSFAPQWETSRHSTHCWIETSQKSPPVHSAAVVQLRRPSTQIPVSVLQRWLDGHSASFVQLVTITATHAFVARSHVSPTWQF